VVALTALTALISFTTAALAAPPRAGDRAAERPAPLTYPGRPVRLIVPFPAGGVPDAVARMVAERLALALGAPVEVDNRTGSAGTMAGEVVSKASSDGHTLLFHQSTMLIQQGVDPMPYDVVRDFTPVVRIASMPLFLVVDARLPMRTPQQWLHAVRSSPAVYSFGSGQAGTPAHLYAEYWIRGVRNGVPLVTAKGEAAVVQEMLAGRISACFCTYATVQAHVRNGGLRLLGVTGAARSPLAPAVPTLQEAGMDGFGSAPWFGVMAPAKTPRAIVTRLATALQKVMNEGEVRERLLSAGLTPLEDSPDAFATAIRSESIQWQVILRQAGGPVNP
jgi:tripartite-type tricarboxylate transporter receptor subunit TctC